MRGRPVAALFGLSGPGPGRFEGESADLARRATDELRAAASLMSEAQRVANFGSWEWRIPENRVVWSDQLFRIFGLEPSSSEGTFEDYLERVHPDDRATVRAEIEAGVGERRAYRFEHRIAAADGEERVLRCQGEPVVDTGSGEVVRVVGVCQDVTDLVRTERAREEADARFRSAFQNAPIGIALVDFSESPDGRMTEVNRALTELVGKSEEELTGAPVTAVGLSEDAELDEALRERLVLGEIDRYSIEKRALLDDRLVWLQLNVSSVPDPTAGTRGIVQVQDVTERKRFEDQLRYFADHDSLTGLMNRRRFREELESLLALQRRYGGEGALLLVDVDDLKEINDSHGHRAGDQLLRRVAEVMRSRMRSTDIVARLAGDEFAVLLPRAEPDHALRLAEELIARMAREQVEGFKVAASVGVVAFGGTAAEPRTVEELTAAADAAMYRAKQRGGAVAELAPAGPVPPRPAEGTPEVATEPEPEGEADAEVRPVTELASRREPASPAPRLAQVTGAFDLSRLVLYAQPAIDLRSGAVAHREVLVRMRDEAGGDHPAADFLAAAAQEPGLCAEIDRWVLARTLAELGNGARQSRLHVNVSGETIRDQESLGWILRELAASEETAWLGLEVPEAAIERDPEAAATALRELAATGSPLILDGFTGSSASFAHVQRMPLDQVKIEGAVTSELLAEDADSRTLRAIVRLAQGMGRTTVAKSVESSALVPLLRMHGVDMAQGFELARPAPLAPELPLSSR
jgi:diguanylate cyclase (GGDEF)-like protein/PAS domain S-box-containing protein